MAKRKKTQETAKGIADYIKTRRKKRIPAEGDADLSSVISFVIKLVGGVCLHTTYPSFAPSFLARGAFIC